MRILVVKLSSLGDTLHALPAVAELKTQLSAEIHWAVQPAFSPLVRTFTCVDHVFEVPRPSDWVGYAKAIGEIRKNRYDWVVDFQGLMKSALVALFAKAPRRIGLSFAREGSRFLTTEIAGKLNKNRHAVDECLDLVKHLGLVMPSPPRFPISVPEINLDRLASLAGKGPRIALAPLSRWESKNWPEAYFAELLKRLVEKYDARVYLIGGASDKAVADRIISSAGIEAANLCGRFSLVDSLGVLSTCNALVSNDSGPMHMAAALSVKCVVPFGPTLPERTGPYGKNHVVLCAGGCPPCHKRVCPKGTNACLLAITPEIVEQALVQELTRHTERM